MRMLALFRDIAKGPDPIGDGGSEVFSYFAFLLFLQCPFERAQLLAQAISLHESKPNMSIVHIKNSAF